MEYQCNRLALDKQKVAYENIFKIWRNNATAPTIGYIKADYLCDGTCVEWNPPFEFLIGCMYTRDEDNTVKNDENFTWIEYGCA
ncbi:hypothetical protein Trydic_g1317 [Trypoxylus dichotomus]